jgi:hypothetical protein
VIVVIQLLAETDILLLKAALLDGEAARLAYEAWRPGIEIETLDYGQQRVLPLLHRNLTRLGISDPLLHRFRGIRHYHWARNQMRLHAAAPVLTELRAGGIPIMALKGAALLLSCLDDSSLRPMEDFDLMVPLDRVTQAIDILVSLGFHPLGCPDWAIGECLSQRYPGFPFLNQAKQNLDLHWHMLHRDQRRNADVAFWRNARPARLAGVEVLIPSFPHQMLQVIVHAAEWNPVAPLRWVADALMILNACREQFDWDELAHEADMRQLAPPVHAALCTLTRELGIVVPTEILSALQRSSGKLDRLEFAKRRIAPGKRSRATRTFLAICDFRRTREDLLGRPFRDSLEPFVADQLHADGVARQAVVLLFYSLGRQRLLRRPLRIDRWARRISNPLPSLAEAIDFDVAPGSHTAFIDGWSAPELTGRWTERREARLAWRLPPNWTGDLDCEIEALLFTPPAWRRPRVEIWANDYLVQVWKSSNTGGRPERRSFTIPAAAHFGRTELVLTFAVRSASSPYQFGLSDDIRALGIHLRHLCFQSGEALAFGKRSLAHRAIPEESAKLNGSPNIPRARDEN